MRRSRKEELAKTLDAVDKLLEQPREIQNISMRIIWELQEDVRMFARELRDD